MRKLFLFAVIAIFGLASCTDEQILDNPQTDGDGISFRTMVGKNPNFKAMELTNAAFQEFWVSAYRTSNDAPLTGLIGEILVPYINNLRVFKTDVALNTWSYGAGTNYYWPGVQKLNFFAHNAGATSVMPTTTNANTDSPCPWFDFTQTSTTLDQKDVVVAKNANEVYSLGRLPVALQFSHALCQINFSLQGAVPGPEFRIKKIRLIGANTVGKYTFLPDDVDPLVYVRRWSGQSTPQPITYFENTASPTYITNTLVSFGDGGVGNKAIMIIPQDGSNLSIEVTYDFANAGVILVADAVATVSLSGQAMNAGKKVRYNLTIPVPSSITGNRIEFTGTVTDWTGEVLGSYTLAN